jgi:hypothetical protein
MTLDDKPANVRNLCIADISAAPPYDLPYATGVSKIQLVGARYPEYLQRMVDR